MNNLKKIKKTLAKFRNFKKLSKNSNKKYKKINHKKPLFLYSIIVLSCIVNIGFGIRIYYKFIDEKTTQYQQIASHIASDYEGFLNYSQLLLNSVNHEILKSKSFGAQTVEILSSIDRIRNQNSVASQMYFDGMLYWIDSNKYLIASSAGKVLKPIDLSSRDYLEKTEHQPWKLQVGKAIIGALSGQYILPIAVGIVGEKGYHLGTSVLSVRIETLISKILMSIPIDSGNFAVFDDKGEMVFGSNKKNKNQSLEKLAKNYDFSTKKIDIVKKFNVLKQKDLFVVVSRVLEHPYTIFYGVENSKIFNELIIVILPFLINLILLLVILVTNLLNINFYNSSARNY